MTNTLLGDIDTAIGLATGVSRAGSTLSFDNSFIASSFSFTLTAFDDALADSPEAIDIQLTNAAITNGTATVAGGASDNLATTITDIDQAIDITLSADTTTIDEEGVTDDDVIYTISLDAAPTGTNIVSVDIANIGTATDADLTNTLLGDIDTAIGLATGVSRAGSTLSFDNSFIASSFSFTLTAFDDALADSPEAIDIQLTNAAITNGTATVAGGASDNLATTITDIDQAIDITLSADTTTIDEEGVTDDDVIYTISLDAAPTGTNIVSVDIANIGTATDADLTNTLLGDIDTAIGLATGVSRAGSTLSFDNSFIASSFSFTLTAFDDALADSPEAIDIQLTNAAITNGTATVAGGASDNLATTITDIDQAIDITLSADTTTIDEEGVTDDDVIYTISLDAAPTGTNIVSVDIANIGTATDADLTNTLLGDIDTAIGLATGVSRAGSTLSFDNSFIASSFSFTLTAFDDALADSPEAIDIQLTNAAITNGTATVAGGASDNLATTITDIDQAIDITLSADTTTIDEEGVTDDDVIYTISLDAAPTGTNIVSVDIANIGTATDADLTNTLLGDIDTAIGLATGVSRAGSTLSFDNSFIASSFSFTLTAFDDALADSPEAIDIQLTNAAITNGTATVAGGASDNLATTITDIDQAIDITLSADTTTIDEEGVTDDDVIYTISLDAAPPAPTSSVSTSPISAPPPMQT